MLEVTDVDMMFGLHIMYKINLFDLDINGHGHIEVTSSKCPHYRLCHTLDHQDLNIVDAGSVICTRLNLHLKRLFHANYSCIFITGSLWILSKLSLMYPM